MTKKTKAKTKKPNWRSVDISDSPVARIIADVTLVSMKLKHSEINCIQDEPGEKCIFMILFTVLSKMSV